MSKKTKAQGPRINRATKNSKNPYVKILKRTLEDSRLSWEARGVFAYILAKPDDWRVNVTDLVRQGIGGRDKVYRIINELIHFGYLERIPIRAEDGRYAGYEIRVYEEPINAQSVPEIRLESESGSIEQPDSASHEVDNKPSSEPPCQDIEEISPEPTPTPEVEPKPVSQNAADEPTAEPSSQDLPQQNLPQLDLTEPEKTDHTNNTIQLSTQTTNNTDILNNNSTNNDIGSSNADSVDPEPVVVVLSSHGLSSTLAAQFAQIYPEEYLLEKIAFLEYEIARGTPISNQAGWLRRAIEQDYARPSGYKSAAEIETEKALEAEKQAAEHRRMEKQRLAREEQKKAAEAAETAQKTEVVEKLGPLYGITEKLIDCWTAGKDYINFHVRDGFAHGLRQALDQTVLLSFQDGHGQIGIWDISTYHTLKRCGKFILRETLAFAMSSILDGRSGTYELVLLEA